MASCAVTSLFFTRLFYDVSEKLQPISDKSEEVVGFLKPGVAGAITLYIIFVGFNYFTGSVSAPLRDTVRRLLLIIIVLGVAVNLGNYQQFLVGWIENTPGELAGAIGGAGPGHGGENTGIGYQLDQTMAKVNCAADNFWQQGGVTDVGPYLIAMFIWTLGVIFAGAASFLVIIAKTFLALLIAIGPLAVLLLLFEATRRYFEAWLTKCLQAGLVIVFTGLVFEAVGDLIIGSAEAASLATPPQFGATLPMDIVLLCMMLVFWQLPTLASELAGGIAIGTMGVVGRAVGVLSGQAASIANAIGGQGSGIASARDRLYGAVGERAAGLLPPPQARLPSPSSGSGPGFQTKKPLPRD